MKEDKKEIILETAERLFSELGFNGTSTRTIAAEAGVNMAMLNYYFGSKEGLYKTIFERRFNGFHQELVGLAEQDISVSEKLDKYVDMFVNRITANNCFQRLLQNEISIQNIDSASTFIFDYMYRNTEELRKILAQGVEEKIFRNIDVEMFIASLLGTKYFLINLSRMTSALFKKDISDAATMTAEIKPRLRAHLKDLTKIFLKP